MTKAVRAHLSTCNILCGLVVAAWVLIPDARAQSPAPTSPNDLFPAELFAPIPHASQSSSDLVIVLWLERHDPLGTLRHQTYDRRKGEYTPAVDAWLKMIGREYPNYVAYVRYVDVGKQDVGDIVRATVTAERNELLPESMIGQLPIKPGRAVGSVSPRPRPSAGASPFKHQIGIRRAPGSGGMSLGTTSSYPFPTPFPYPRPHP
ncbi:MAG: hypothetical protein P4L84_06770 [Isosphaeraceae bacterium]|nr:hypothetical protein [Isosphaeraceae bacterium]